MPFDFITDPRWKSLDEQTKNLAISMAFADEVESDKRWASLDENIKKAAKDEYFADAMQVDAIQSVPEERSAIGDIGAGLVHGGIGLIETAGTATQWVGNRIGSKTIADVGKTASEYWEKKAAAYGPSKDIAGKNIWDNPEILADTTWWLYNVSDMIPALAASVVPGSLAAKGIQAATAIPKLAKLGGAIVGGGLEGAQTYKAVLNKGGTEEQAARSGELMTLGAGILNALSVGKILGKAGTEFKGRVIKHLGAAAWEGVTEGLEEPTEVFSKYFGAYLSGQPLPEDLQGQLIESAKAALTVAPIAAVAGGGASVMHGAEKILDAPDVDTAIKEFETAIETPVAPLHAIDEDAIIDNRIPVGDLWKTPVDQVGGRFAQELQRKTVRDKVETGVFVPPEVIKSFPDIVPPEDVLEAPKPPEPVPVADLQPQVPVVPEKQPFEMNTEEFTDYIKKTQPKTEGVKDMLREGIVKKAQGEGLVIPDSVLAEVFPDVKLKATRTEIDAAAALKGKSDPLGLFLEGDEKAAFNKKLADDYSKSLEPKRQQIAAIDAEISLRENEIAVLSAEMETWKAKVYKGNESKITTGDTGGFDNLGTRKTIGDINEAKRQRRIANIKDGIDSRAGIISDLHNKKAEVLKDYPELSPSPLPEAGGKQPWEGTVYRVETGGTPGEFATDIGDFGQGVYHALRKEKADSYSRMANKQDVVEQKIRLENPLVIEAKDAYDMAKTYGLTPAYGYGIRKENLNPKNLQKQLSASQKMTADLVDKGYDGIVIERPLTDFEKAHGETIPNNEIVVFSTPSPLPTAEKRAIIQEARKYKSADEFVKANTYYRGQDYQGELGDFFTPSKKEAQKFATKVHEIQIAPEDIYKPDIVPKATSSQIDNAIGEAKRKGFKAMFVDENKVTGSPQGKLSLYIFDKKGIKTKSQLTDIWDKAQEGESPSPLPEAGGKQPWEKELYHGTPVKSESLEIGHLSPRDKNYTSAVVTFTDDAKLAKRYAGKTGDVKTSNVDMKNPINLGDGEDTLTVRKFLEKIGSDKTASEFGLNPTGFIEQWKIVSYNRKIVEELKRLGYDGAIWKENKGKSNTYAIFDNNQVVKSPSPLPTSGGLPKLYDDLSSWIESNNLKEKIGIKGDIQDWIASQTGRTKGTWEKRGVNLIKTSNTSLETLSRKGLFGDTENGEYLRQKLIEITRLRQGKSPSPLPTATPAAAGEAIKGEAIPEVGATPDLNTQIATLSKSGLDAEQIADKLGIDKKKVMARMMGEFFGEKAPKAPETTRPIRFEAGKKLSKEERKEVLRSIGDAYKDNQAPKELKYIDERTGEEVYGYAYSPESMHTSDVTGRKIRHYLWLPDGRKAHPSELFPEITQAAIDRAISEAEYAAKQEGLNKKAAKVSVATNKAESVEEANKKFKDRNKGAFEGMVKRVDGSILLEKNGKEFIRVQTPSILSAALEDGFTVKMRNKDTAWADEIIGKTKASSEVEPKARKAPAGPRTIRGRILEMGGLNFGNFKGEAKSMGLAVRMLQRKAGEPIDTAEKALKEEGWLREDESLLDLLRDEPDILRRGIRSGEDILTKPERELTEDERRIKKEMQWEPESPPEGEYETVNAEDLPVGKKLTIIDGNSKDGWDTYEVVDKDEFGITLKDGTTIELGPLDKVEVLKTDLGEKVSPAPEPAAKQEEPKLGDTVRFTPDEEYADPVEGMIQDVIKNQSGDPGYHIFAPTKTDPTRTHRVWLNKGKIKVLKSYEVPKKEAVTPSASLIGPKPRTRLDANAAELAADYKARGIERQATYGQFVKDRNLKPEMNAKEFHKIFDSVTPELFDKPVVKPKREAAAKGLEKPVNMGDAEESKPLTTDTPDETINDRLGEKRGAVIGKLIDTTDNSELRLSLKPDTSSPGQYSVVMSDGKRSNSVRMMYKGGEKLAAAMGHFEHYMNTDDIGRFKVELNAAQVSKEATVPKEKKPLGSSNDERLRFLRKIKESGRSMTYGAEKSLAILESQAAADPSKWTVGDGVGWKVLNQTNRGYQVVEIRPETKEAIIRPVADTGLTVDGTDRMPTDSQLVHIADLVRDNKYNKIQGKPPSEQSTIGPKPPEGVKENVDIFGEEIPGQQTLFGDTVEKAKRKAVSPKKEKTAKREAQLDLFTGKHEPIQPQLFDAFPKEKLPELTKPDPTALGGIQNARVASRMVSTGYVPSAGLVVRDLDDAAALLENYKEVKGEKLYPGQEKAYFITVDKDGIVLELHFYSKGTKGNSLVMPSETIGRIFNTPRAAKVYFRHNHPSGTLRPSPEDVTVNHILTNMLALKNIGIESFIVSGDKWVDMNGNIKDVRNSIRKTNLPIQERYLAFKSGPEAPKINDSIIAKERFNDAYGDIDGILFLDSNLTERGFMPMPAGKSIRDAAAEIIAAAEELNSSAIVINSKQKAFLGTPRSTFFKNLITAIGDIQIMDVIDQGKSLTGQGILPVKSLNAQSAMAALDSDTPLYSTTPGNAGVTLEDVQVMFKGQDAGLSEDGSIWVRTKGGQGLVIRNVNHIAIDKAAFEIAHGSMNKAGELATGKYQDGTIELQRDLSDRWTLAHEQQHWMEDTGIMSPLEIETLKSKIRSRVSLGKFDTLNKKDIGGKEDRATFISSALKNRDTIKNYGTAVQRILQKIFDFVDGLVNLVHRTARGIARDIESGKLVSRETTAGAKTATGAPLFTFAGPKALTANRTALDEAAESLRYGPKDPAEAKEYANAIRRRTGWFLGQDKKWRYEIDDSDLKFKNLKFAPNRKIDGKMVGEGWSSEAKATLGDVINHPELFKAYPAMKNIGVDIKYGSREKEGSRGHFTGKSILVSAPNEAEAKSLVVHEITHAIQEIEGFARGGAPFLMQPDLYGQAGFALGRTSKEYRDASDEVDEILKRNGDVGPEELKGKDAERYNELNEYIAELQTKWIYNKYGNGSAEINLIEISQRIGRERYEKLAGEIEAKESAERQGLTAEQREIFQPFKDGIPDAIVSFKGGAQLFSAKLPEGIAAAEAVNKEIPGNNVTFDRIQEGVEEEDKLYQFTARDGKAKGATFYTESLDVEEIKMRLNEILESFKGASQYSVESAAIPASEYEANRAIQKNVKIQAAGSVSKFLSEIKEGADKFLGSISTRLERVSPKLKKKIRDLDFDIGTQHAADTKAVLPLLKKARKMTKNDFTDWDYARKNSDKDKVAELVEKYDMADEYEDYRNVITRIRQEGVDVGMDIGWIEDYFPRVIKDTRGFLLATGRGPERALYSDMLENKAKEMGITVAQMDDDMKANLISNMILGNYTGIAGVSFTKERKLKTIPKELNQFYADSDSSIMQYIYSMRKGIETRKFFGKIPKKVAEMRKRKYAAQSKIRELNREIKNQNVSDAETTRTKIDSWESLEKEYDAYIKEYAINRDYTNNIGSYVMELINNNEISPEHERIVNEILKARFHEHGTRGVIQAYKNLSYIDTMGSPISALTQIGDLAWAAYVGGVYRTTKYAYKSLRGQSTITKEGIGQDRIAQEFADSGTLGNAVSWVFKHVGLEKIDAIGKEALLNAALDVYQKQARKNPNKLKMDIRKVFEGETDELIADLQSGEITDNVKKLVYYRLLDFQPVTLSEMPQKYLDAGNGRLFYMLKTFTLKQFDAFRQEGLHKIRTGNSAEKIQGMKNIVRLGMFFVLANAGADELKDWILGRKTDFDDRVVDNVLRLFGVSKFVTWKARTEGVGSALSRQILPPFKFIDSAGKDIITAGDEKGLELIGSIPLIGKLAYWHLGRGVSKRDDLWDRRLRKHKARLKSIKEDFDKSKDKMAFMQTHRSGLTKYQSTNKFQGKLNRYRKIINTLKSMDETPSRKKRIAQLENRRTESIKIYLNKGE